MQNKGGELSAVLSEVGRERHLCLEVRKWEKVIYKRFSQQLSSGHVFFLGVVQSSK